jgi:site-specific recombinase XerD
MRGEAHATFNWKETTAPSGKSHKHARKSQRVPVVFARQEVTKLAQLVGTSHLMASLLYGAELRLMECVRLRIKSVDGEPLRLCRNPS